MNNHMLVRRTNWNDYSASLSEWWELYEYRKNWLGKFDWRPVKTYGYYMDGRTHKQVAQGDRRWAEKTAKHYGVKVPEATHE